MKYIRLVGLLGLLTVLVVVAVDCTSSHKPLDTEADFTGWVTEIHPIGGKGTLGQILAEDQSDKLVAKYMVTIKDETLIFEQNGQERRQVTFTLRVI